MGIKNMMPNKTFDSECKACRRLNRYLSEIKDKYPTYHSAPVNSFGDNEAQLLIVGLAPGMHGANATERPFTGDASGMMLYQALFDFGFRNQAESTSVDDGLVLMNCRITNAVKCLPPENKPIATEIKQCNSFLAAELNALKVSGIVMALGGVAHQAVLKAYGLKLKEYKFGHNKSFQLPDGKILVSSYHCSRYNIQTKRLTKKMFNDVFNTIVREIKSSESND